MRYQSTLVFSPAWPVPIVRPVRAAMAMSAVARLAIGHTPITNREAEPPSPPVEVNLPNVDAPILPAAGQMRVTAGPVASQAGFGSTERPLSVAQPRQVSVGLFGATGVGTGAVDGQGAGRVVTVGYDQTSTPATQVRVAARALPETPAVVYSIPKAHYSDQRARRT